MTKLRRWTTLTLSLSMILIILDTFSLQTIASVRGRDISDQNTNLPPSGVKGSSIIITIENLPTHPDDALIQCRGEKLKRLLVIQCYNQEKCHEFDPCLRDVQKCKHFALHYQAVSCGDGGTQEEAGTCLKVYYSNTHTSGIIHCEQEDGTGLTRHFFKGVGRTGTVWKYQLVSPSLKDISDTFINGPPIKIVAEGHWPGPNETETVVSYDDSPSLYTNENYEVSCIASKFLFKHRLSLATTSSPEVFLAPTTLTESRNFWKLKLSKDALLTHDSTISSLTCVGVMWLDHGVQKWPEALFVYRIVDPHGPIIIDQLNNSMTMTNETKDKKEAAIPKITCPFTGGPATVKWHLHYEGQSKLETELLKIDQINAYGQIREAELKLNWTNLGQKLHFSIFSNKKNWLDFTCEVVNDLGHDFQTFSTFVEWPSETSETLLRGTVSIPVIVIIIIVVCLLLIVGFVSLVFVIQRRRRKRSLENFQMDTELSNGPLDEFTEDQVQEILNGVSDLQMLTSDEEVMSQELPAYLSLPIDSKYAVPQQGLKISEKVLGRGQFGIVYAATLNGQQVAAKTTTRCAAVEYLTALQSELKIMAYVGKHENIVELLGVDNTRLKERIVLVILELSPLGNLNDYLKKMRSKLSRPRPSPRLPSKRNGSKRDKSVTGCLGSNGNIDQLMLIGWCAQIANAMKYLESKNVIHSDLATRNVLVFEENLVKISDFGLSRKLYMKSYYVKRNMEPLPWPWLSLESLRFLEFSTASDVWSFGVTVWEIMSYGQVPYNGQTWSIEFSDGIADGRIKLSKPDLASDIIYAQLEKCWLINPKERPTFEELHNFFLKLLQ